MKRNNRASLGVIDQPGGVVEYVHSSLSLGVPPFDTDAVHPSGFCWTLDQPFDLALTKSVVPSSVLSGGSVTYTVVVTNGGPGTRKCGLDHDRSAPCRHYRSVLDGYWRGVRQRGIDRDVHRYRATAPTGNGEYHRGRHCHRGRPTLKNVAFEAPNPSDPPEINPLGTPPTLGTPTQTTPTNNDGEARQAAGSTADAVM